LNFNPDNDDNSYLIYYNKECYKNYDDDDDNVQLREITLRQWVTKYTPHGPDKMK
jgi:hypothetical protein